MNESEIHTTPKDKMRARLARQVAAFKKAGGKVQKIPNTLCDLRNDKDWRNHKRRAELKKKRGLA